MRRRDRRRLFTEAMTDGLMRAPRLPGPIPQLHDLQVVWGGPGWKDIMPVTADAIEASIITGPTRPHTNTNTSSATTPTNENYNYNLNTDGGSVSADTKSAAASTVISATGTNQVRIDVLQVAVLIAMPDPASTQSSRRNRGRLKQKRSTEVEAGDVHEHEDDSYYDHDELPILMIGVTRVSPGDYSVDSEVE
ncbi:hypothetical protein BJ165DRAFT_1470713 [Panaeolus papilionaceus]|nr:hypothetical protein BJ165DRAFT_1470713 [Panaeolus papilionaceus]